MKIAFFGLGSMGSAIAPHLAATGHELIVWNRSLEKAKTFAAQHKAKAESLPIDAVRNSEIVFSMLMDDDATEKTLLSTGALDALRPDSIHVSLSTLSVPFAKKLTAEHKKRGQHHVGSPVFGRPNVAAEAQLYIVAAGANEPIERVRPLLEKISRAIRVVSPEPATAHALKLAGNFLIATTIASLSEAAIAAEALGTDPETFLEVVNDALFRSPFYKAYANFMLHPPTQPGASIAVGEKDTRLFAQAASAEGIHTPLANAIHDRLKKGLEQLGKEADWPSGYYQLSQKIDGKTR